MPLMYLTTETHPEGEGAPLVCAAHVFRHDDGGRLFLYCEHRDGSTFWCNRVEGDVPALQLMFGMKPAPMWTDAVASIPPARRLAALLKKGGVR